MRRLLIPVGASLVLGAVAAPAEEAVPQDTDAAAVVCNVCSARKQGKLKLKEAREAQAAKAEAAEPAEPAKAEDE